ncbi:chemokine-like factor [Myotis lucifugus]|uniref:chemokine-like factor n=1 Tax=Myotis lucifugus TaxID=59463 RepID=UPI000CCC7353|nr:chemokine-like factor [Myotis lucifugus]
MEHRPFCCSVKGFVKMLRLALTATSMTLFIITQAPEPYIVITGFEVTIILFFIILYMLRLDRIITFLFWPLLDLLNDLFATAFLAGAVAFAVQSRQTMPVNYFVAVATERLSTELCDPSKVGK